MQVLVVDSGQDSLPTGTTDLLSDIGWQITKAADYRAALDKAKTGAIDAVILFEPHHDLTADRQAAEFHELLRLLDAQRIAALMLSDRAGSNRSDSRSLIEVVDRRISQAELRGRLAMIERYHGLLKRMEQELRNMERLSKRLNQHFREVDEELRLAGRLQRDFLPDIRKPIGNVRIATVYRPASWVSGDMFDVFRIDEEHTGIYLADAVGHGMAASLLTMFIKRSIVPKRVHADRYTVASPSEVMAALNDALADQSLPNCQFVTACYALLNHKTLTLQYARGGHPYPILITAGGVVSEMKASGGLLGLFKGEEFPLFETRLQPGDKVLFYTDGVELAFQDQGDASLDTKSYQRAFESLAGLPVETMMQRIETRLDAESGSLSPRDDVTIVGLEVLSAP